MIGEIIYPIPRISYDHAIEILSNNDVDIQWGEDRGFHREKILGTLLRKNSETCFS